MGHLSWRKFYALLYPTVKRFCGVKLRSLWDGSPFSLEVTDSCHREHRKKVRKVVLVQDNDGCSAESDLIAIGNFVFLSISHLDDKWNPFP